MSIIPDGLTLHVLPGGEQLGLIDVQDVCHLIFTEGGNGDPIDWHIEIVRRTCEALDVTTAFDEFGEEMKLDDFLDDWSALVAPTGYRH